MKAIIKSATFKREFESKFGTLYSHEIKYDDKTAYYNSKSQDQNKFVAGQEAEFTEETRQGKKGTYLQIKPIKAQNYQSNYGRALTREQARYSSFGVSYVKDLIIAGIIPIEQWESASTKIATHMMELDKKLQG